MSGDTVNLDKLTEEILSSRKYKEISPDLIRRIGQTELMKRRNLKDATKETKNKLHQVTGAFLDNQPAYEKLISELENAVASQEIDLVKNACLKILACHNSTKERSPELGDFYPVILDNSGPIHSILDIACGLNPLTIPWMNLQSTITYHAWDVSQTMMTFLHQAIQVLGHRPDTQVVDILSMDALPETDWVFILKTLPSLEQLEKGAARKLLRLVKSSNIIVSFPVHSLGGRPKGMLETYTDDFESLLRAENWNFSRFVFPSELVYRVQKYASQT